LLSLHNVKLSDTFLNQVYDDFLDLALALDQQASIWVLPDGKDEQEQFRRSAQQVSDRRSLLFGNLFQVS
jgi:hypothetical protein